MAKPKFPLRLQPVERQTKSPLQDLAFGRSELESAARFIDSAGFQGAANKLRAILAGLPPAMVHELGCRGCNGDVPLEQPDLISDRICRGCAEDYDRAVAERRHAMRQARLDAKRLA
jgi:hypothetical protein